MGYLGKISAVVSVNTGDFAAKLNRCADDVTRFADATKRDLKTASQSAAKSFGSIYTEVQKLERALLAASTLKLDFTGLKGFEGKGLQEAVAQMRQMHSIAAQLSSPLAKAKTSVESMSDAVKAALHPAMVQAQTDVERLQTRIEIVGSVGAKEFAKAEKKVLAFAAAVRLADEATKSASAMAGASGFRFKNPSLSDEFKRGGALFSQVDALPADRMTSGLVRLIGLQKAAADEAVRLTAAMAASPSQGTAIGLAQTQKALEGINNAIEKTIRSYENMDAVAASVGQKTVLSEDISGLLAFRQRELLAKNEGKRTVLREDITGQIAFQQREKDAARNKAAKDLFGADVGSPERKIDSLKAKASSLRADFDKLPEPLQGKLASTLARLRDEFARLTPKSSAADVQRVTIQYERLEKVVKRLNQAAAFKGTFADTLADSGAKKYAEQLQKIETAMAHVGAAARGPTATAINAFRAALMAATSAGTIGTDKVRESIQALTNDIEKAIVAEGKLTAKQARAVMGGATQTGDVRRGLSGKLSLGLNQAAYIVDDFMSATGGAEQKLRAISNNITQLGFVVGSTTGLFIALGSVIALQGYLALTKWINSGRSAEDQTKALNDSLEKQKSLTDSLAQSFESLADSIAQSSMSAESFSGKQLDKQLSEIKNQQKDLREEELYRLSPDVNAARASQNLADNEIKKATTEAAMLAAQNRMTQAKSDEDRAKAGVRARASAGLSNPEIVSAIAQSFRPEAKFSASRNFEAGGDIFSPEAINAAAARLAERFLDQAASTGQSGADVLAARSLELSKRGRSGSAIAGDQEAMVSLQRSIEILKLPVKEGADNLAVSVSRASSEAASRIKEAQDRVAEAIQAGTPGAAEFSVALSKTADALALAQGKIMKAAAESDPAARAALINSAKQEVAAISGEASRQLAASRGMMFDGLGVKGGKGGQLSGLRRVEGAGGALAALEGSAEFGGRGGAQATALRGLIAKEVTTRADLARAMTFGSGGQKMQAAFNLEQAQEQLRRFTDGLPEEIKAAGDAVKMAARQSGKDEKSRAEIMERGRDLLASPKSKTVAAFRKDLEAATMAAGGPGGAGVAEFVKNRLMEAAPAIAQMNAERAAAINPPYFSALQSSDTSTMDGQRELNRLLRGDDASKDKNLDELKTQSDLIRELIAVAKQQGIVVEL